MDTRPGNEDSDPEDILSTSLQTIYGYQPITHSSAGSLFTYTSKVYPPLTITLCTPDTQPANWSLHASSIWVSSLFLADHIEDLHLDQYVNSAPFHLLELGAAAGLPGILISKIYKHVLVTVSDYPDTDLIQTLSGNVALNDTADNCRVVPYAWGSDVSALSSSNKLDGKAIAFDVIVAADTLWNPESHSLFVQTLQMTLKRSPDARIHLIAGLHTGRYTLQSFLDVVKGAGFDVVSALEKEASGTEERIWDVLRAEQEDERERRRWVVWITLRWKQGL